MAVVTDVATITAQKINDELALVLGEWSFDMTEGFPWQLTLGQKGPNIVAQFRARIRNALLQTPAVVSVVDLSVALNTVTRALTYSAQVLINTGQVLVGGSGQPFVVQGGTS